MKVLFVRSGNNGIEPISTLQGQSLEKIGLAVFYYDVIGKGILGYLKNVNKLRSYLKSIKPDVIHAHYSDKGILTLLTLSNLPLVVSLMGSDILSVSKLHIYLIRICTNIWNATIVKSAQLHKILDAKNNVIILPNGVDFDVFHPVEKQKATQMLGWNSDKINILFCSDPRRKEKNFKLAEEAIRLLNSHKKKYVIHYLKEIPINEMKYYYSAADILLMTSLYEGSPNVIKEAMACNCPIVSTAVGDVNEVIGSTEGCFLASFDPQDICAKILLAIKFSNDRTHGRENIKHLESKTIANKLRAIYQAQFEKV